MQTKTIVVTIIIAVIAHVLAQYIYDRYIVKAGA